jgi:UDP-galactopyranose mutase
MVAVLGPFEALPCYIHTYIQLKDWNNRVSKLENECSAKLDSEARRLTNLVGQVQKETEAEFVAVKEQLQIVSTGFETRLEQSVTRTRGMIDELANQQAEVEVTLNKLDHDMNNKLSRH